MGKHYSAFGVFRNDLRESELAKLAKEDQYTAIFVSPIKDTKFKIAQFPIMPGLTFKTQLQRAEDYVDYLDELEEAKLRVTKEHTISSVIAKKLINSGNQTP